MDSNKAKNLSISSTISSIVLSEFTTSRTNDLKRNLEVFL